MSATMQESGRRLLNPLRVAAASACFALALVGVVVPGLPTTIFLIVGCSLVLKSHPGLAARVMAWPAFRPFRPYVLERGPMSRRARNVAMAVMWGAIALSVASILVAAELHAAFALLPLLLGAAGSVAIVRAASPSRSRP